MHWCHFCVCVHVWVFAGNVTDLVFPSGLHLANEVCQSTFLSTSCPTHYLELS